MDLTYLDWPFLDETHRDFARALGRFAASEAERQHLTACADHLRTVLEAVRTGDFTSADNAVVQAQAVFNGPR